MAPCHKGHDRKRQQVERQGLLHLQGWRAVRCQYRETTAGKYQWQRGPMAARKADENGDAVGRGCVGVFNLILGKTPELDCFGDVVAAQFVLSCQVGDSSGDAQDAMVSASYDRLSRVSACRSKAAPAASGWQ